MKVSFIKYKNDSKSYKMAKGLGMDVFEIDSPELIDKKIEELEKDEYSGRFYTPIPEIGNHRSDMKETAIPF